MPGSTKPSRHRQSTATASVPCSMPPHCRARTRSNPPSLPHSKQSYQANVRQQVFTKLTLQLISSCFEKAGIDWIVLKGLPQARLLYRDPAYRSSKDIDILVPPRDFRRAAGVLEAAAFAPVNPPLSPLIPTRRRSMVSCATLRSHMPKFPAPASSFTNARSFRAVRERSPCGLSRNFRQGNFPRPPLGLVSPSI